MRFARWWFQKLCYFHPLFLGKIPILTIVFFRWVETTNQLVMVKFFLLGIFVGERLAFADIPRWMVATMKRCAKNGVNKIIWEGITCLGSFFVLPRSINSKHESHQMGWHGEHPRTGS